MTRTTHSRAQEARSTASPSAPKLLGRIPVPRSMRFYEAVLLAVAAIWGLSFVVLRSATVELPAPYVVGIRYTGAALVLGVLFRRRIARHLDAAHLKAGAALGVLVYLGFLSMSIGAMGTSPGKNAFLTSAYCVLVPFLAWPVARRRPGWPQVFAGVVCAVGMALLTLRFEDGLLSAGTGELFAVGAAFFLGLHMVFVPRLTQGRDVLTVTVLQFATSGVLGFVVGAATGAPLELSRFTESGVVLDLLYLIVLSTCLGSLLQNVCQRHVPASQVSLIVSSESVFALVFGILLAGEVVTPQSALGFVLIGAALLVNERHYLKHPPDDQGLIG